ncbi:MAG: hypothetical protein ACYCVD_02750 [Desulfitobacteriaceae bacterium]
MDGAKEKEALAEPRASIGNLKVTVTFEIDGLKELKELTESLSRFVEKGLMANFKVGV